MGQSGSVTATSGGSPTTDAHRGGAPSAEVTAGLVVPIAAAVTAVALGAVTVVLLGGVGGPDTPVTTGTSAAPVAISPTRGAAPADVTVATPSARPTASTPPTGAPVNAGDYLVATGDGGDYYAVAPSGNIACGILGSGTDDVVAGCQTTYRVPQIDCGPDIDASAPIVSWAGGVLSLECVTEGVFHPAAAARTLPYGSSLTVGDFTMVSTATGMWMVDGGGDGFRVNRGEGVVLFNR